MERPGEGSCQALEGRVASRVEFSYRARRLLCTGPSMTMPGMSVGFKVRWEEKGIFRSLWQPPKYPDL